MDETLILLIRALIKAVIILTMVMLSAATFVYMERRVSAFIQMRLGPNRVGPMGLFQPFADVFKLFMKEDVVPKAADNKFHRLAAIISLGVTVAVFSVIPFGDPITGLTEIPIQMGIAPDVNIGLLFILAMTSVGVYGLTLAGWSSNNKYSLLGGLRSSAQMISYELSMGLSIVAVVMVVGSLGLRDIVHFQAEWAGWRWMIFLQPLGFIIFLVSAFAETNRAPFDLPEAEPELVGGFNTEYSGMKFGMFFLAEYGNMALSSAFITLLYLGGYNLPVPPETLGLEPGSALLSLIQVAILVGKVIMVGFFFIWVRWSIPRFRYDKLMYLGWKVLLPLSLINVVITGIVLFVLK